jgi:ABC-type transport system substrate-binding protein
MSTLRRFLGAAMAMAGLTACLGCAKSVKPVVDLASPSTTAGSTSTSSSSTTVGPPPTSLAPATTIAPNQSGILTTITSADSGETLDVRVGDSIRLLLSDAGTQWTNTQVEPDQLFAGDPTPSPPPHGVLLIWTARQTGTAKITATGTAWCAPGTACPMWARLFEVTLNILTVGSAGGSLG